VGDIAGAKIAGAVLIRSGLVLLLVMLCTGWLFATACPVEVELLLVVALAPLGGVCAHAGTVSNAVSVSSSEHRMGTLLRT